MAGPRGTATKQGGGVEECRRKDGSLGAVGALDGWCDTGSIDLWWVRDTAPSTLEVHTCYLLRIAFADTRLRSELFPKSEMHEI